MASVTFPTSLGGDGSTVTDDSNPATGLANGGHRTRFVPSMAQNVACMAGAIAQAQQKVTDASGQVALAEARANAASSSAAAAAASASTAINAPGTSATSTTSIAIGTGSKTITVQTGKAFVVGQPVMVAATVAPSTQWMAGNITAYNSATGSLTVDVVWTRGSGTVAAWTVSLAGPANPAALNKAGDTATGPIGIPEDILFVSTNTTAVRFKTYVMTASLTLTLPASPAAGDWVAFANRSGTSTPVIGRNGQNIMGLAEDMTVDNNNYFGTLVFADATRGWIFQ